MELIDKISIEKGEHFLTLNENSNTLYVSNNKSDTIQVIDCSTLKEIHRISVEKPRQLAINPSNNVLFAVCENAGFWLRDNGAKISVIDAVSNEIITTIGKKEGFGDIGINNETNMVYATQPKSRKIWIIDGHTRKVVDKIKVSDNYYVLAVDSKDNRIFIGGNTRGMMEKPIFSQIDCTNNNLAEISRKATFVKHRPKKIYFSKNYNLLFCLMDESAHSDSDRKHTYIRQIDLNSDSFGNRSEKMNEYDRMGFDDTKDRIYYTDSNNGEIQVLDHTLSQIGLFKFAEKSRKHGKNKICVNSRFNHVYISEEVSNILYVLTIP